jgi:hypothetical protein
MRAFCITGVAKTMKKLMILFAAAAMTMIPMTASAARVVVFGGYGYHPGFYGGYYGDPYFWGPAYPAYPVTGEVKIETKLKDDELFINGAFAGTTKESKTLHLRPGTYNIEVRHLGESVLNERVFVAAGKTLHLHPAA